MGKKMGLSSKCFSVWRRNMGIEKCARHRNQRNQ